MGRSISSMHMIIISSYQHIQKFKLLLSAVIFFFIVMSLAGRIAVIEGILSARSKPANDDHMIIVWGPSLRI